MTTLRLFDSDLGLDEEGVEALAKMLRGGGCPRLEELDVSGSQVGDDAVVELARALGGERGAACGATLRRLNLSECGITSYGARRLDIMEKGDDANGWSMPGFFMMEEKREGVALPSIRVPGPCWQ